MCNGGRSPLLDEDGYVQLQLPEDRADEAVNAHPTGERLTRMGKPIGEWPLPTAELSARGMAFALPLA